MTNKSHNWLKDLVVLVPFTRDYAGEFSGTYLAKALQLPQKTVARKLDNLSRFHLLSYRTDGKNKYYSLDKDISFTLIQIIESSKEVKFLLEYPELYLLFKDISLISPVILFGSYAKGLAKEGSDLDLIIMGRKNKTMDKIISRCPIKISAEYLSYQLLNTRLREKQALALEIVKDHILFGDKDDIIKLFKK